MDMHLLVGLGNPGTEYDSTRHNVGFMVLDHWVAHHGGRWSWNKQNGWVADVTVGGTRILAAKPATYMNLSGEFIQPLAHFFKIPTDRIIAIHDDMDLPLGRIRLARGGGGSGGHRGIASMQQHLGGPDFARFKIGIGHPPERHRGVDYVLTRFHGDESPIWAKVLTATREILDHYLSRGLEDAMNRFNRFNAVPPPPKPPKPPKPEEPLKPEEPPKPEGTAGGAPMTQSQNSAIRPGQNPPGLPADKPGSDGPS